MTAQVPPLPISAKVRDRSLPPSQLTPQHPFAPSHHTLTAQELCSLGPRLCAVLQSLSLFLCTGRKREVTPGLRWEVRAASRDCCGGGCQETWGRGESASPGSKGTVSAPRSAVKKLMVLR